MRCILSKVKDEGGLYLTSHQNKGLEGQVLLRKKKEKKFLQSTTKPNLLS